MTRDTIEEIAKLAHEMNRTYCEMIGDLTQKPWDYSPDWQKESAISGVKFHLANPHAKPEDSHMNWYRDKLAAGWGYGPVKDETTKTHPCMVDYDKLSEAQRVKDVIFIATVRTWIRLEGEDY